MKQILIILLSLILFSCQSSTPQLDEKETSNTETEIKEISIDSVAISFINDYINYLDYLFEHKNANVDSIDWLQNQPLATKAFKQDLNNLIDQAEKKDPEYGLGIDPILNAQDYPSSFTVESVDSIGNYVTVVGSDWKDFKLTLKLIKQDNTWLVDGCGAVRIPDDKRKK